MWYQTQLYYGNVQLFQTTNKRQKGLFSPTSGKKNAVQRPVPQGQKGEKHQTKQLSTCTSRQTKSSELPPGPNRASNDKKRLNKIKQRKMK